ncbi:hypothetical protein [Parabacteroides pacaensis]|uniref:hypothetical protein n=1 Tax=Parabacteroides pacaensis TaxID=2086575 RepID=UPI000D0F8FBC|nr:hypothetical protein [Parabacteroides pacaensis]
MIIYNNSGGPLLNIQVNDKSYRYRSIMKDNSLTLYYSLVQHVELPVGSYIEFQGERYTLWRPENFKKHSSRNFEYTVTFGGNQERLKKVKYKLLSSIPRKLKFDLVGNPAMFIDLLVDNLNAYDSGWSRGICIEAAQKNLAFNHEFCYDVLNRLAEEFDTEWEIAGKTINFCKVEKFKTSPVPLSYGKGHGFRTGVGRVNEGDKQPVNLLYVQGGEKNLDFSTYGSKTLLLPTSQRLSYNGNVYVTDEHGMYITRSGSGLNDINEDSIDCSDIYPKRVGTVSSVIEVDEDGKDITDEEPAEGEEKKKAVFYDFTDSSIPEGLDFSKYRIAGEKATVIFQTGLLAGKEFDLEQTEDELTGYIHKERRFKIVQQEYDGILMPSAEWNISPGDEYAVFNIALPGSYVCDNGSQTGASWDMFREAARYFSEHEESSFTFSGELDPIHAKKNWLSIGGKLLPGGYVLFSDLQFQPSGILIRITGVKDYINKPYSPQLELSNLPVSGTILNDLGKIDANEVTTDSLYKDSIAFTKRRFRDARETQNMLEEAFLNFSKGVNPVWVQTMSILVGSESLQFRFVNNKDNPQEVDHSFIYNSETKIFSTPAGILQHLTLGVDTYSSSHEPSEYLFWDMAEYASPFLGDKGALYLYAKCAKEGTTGEFILSEEAFRMDPVDGYYYFLAGTLGTETDGKRSFVTLYGFTEIGPGWMRINKIISPDGKTYFDVANSEIGGRIKFAKGSAGIENLDEWTGISNEIQKAQNAANAAQREISEVTGALGDFQDIVNGTFKDGIISEAEAKAIEKYINILTVEKADVDAQYAKLYASPYLEGTAKTNLLNANITYKGAHEDLIQAIQTAISDDKTTIAEKNEVDSRFVLYSQALANLSTRIQEANTAIQDKLKGFSDTASDMAQAAQDAANTAKQTASEAAREAEASVSRLNEWASDHHISPAEKTALKQQENDIKAEYQEITLQTARYNLNTSTAWTDYYNAYLKAINALDKYTAPSPENISVESDYNNIATYYTRRQTILESIAVAAKAYVDNIKAELERLIQEQLEKIQELDYLKEAISNETTVIGGLLLTSLVKLGVKDGTLWQEKAGINGTAKNDNDVVAWYGGLLTEAIKDLASIVFRLDGSGQLAKGNVRWDAKGNVIFDGTVYGRDGIFAGSLEGVSGSFKNLKCVNSKGEEMGRLTFDGDSGRIWFDNGDIQHQGGKDGRSLRFLSSDIWCRGGFGARMNCTMVVYGSYAYYYTNGLGGSKKVTITLTPLVGTNTETYYNLPLYCANEDGAGMPVGLVIFNVSSGTYRYNMVDSFDATLQVDIKAVSKTVKVVNGSDAWPVHIYSNGFLQELPGGCVADYTNIEGFMLPSLPPERLGRGWLRNGYEDNNWR